MHPAVHQAIVSLVAENKTPTVALTKARLTEPVPMPVIIAGLSAFKNDPKCIESTPPKLATKTTSELSQLDRIEQKLDKLLALLEKEK